MPDRTEARYMLTRPKAEALAKRIRDYWFNKHGVMPRVWIEPLNHTNREFVVRSTIEMRAAQ
jgi:hypothetical protein